LASLPRLASLSLTARIRPRLARVLGAPPHAPGPPGALLEALHAGAGAGAGAGRGGARAWTLLSVLVPPDREFARRFPPSGPGGAGGVGGAGARGAWSLEGGGGEGVLPLPVAGGRGRAGAAERGGAAEAGSAFFLQIAEH